MRHTFVRAAAALTGATFALALTANAPAQDAGVKQVEQLVKKAEATVAAIGETKLQLTKTRTCTTPCFRYRDRPQGSLQEAPEGDGEHREEAVRDRAEEGRDGR